MSLASELIQTNVSKRYGVIIIKFSSGGEEKNVLEFKMTLQRARILVHGRLHDCFCCGQLGRSNNDLGRGMLKNKLSNP